MLHDNYIEVFQYCLSSDTTGKSLLNCTLCCLLGGGHKPSCLSPVSTNSHCSPGIYDIYFYFLSLQASVHLPTHHHY